MFFAYALIFGAFFMWADRWSGGGFGWQKLGHDNGGPLRSHPRNYVLLAILAVYIALAMPLIVASWFGVSTFKAGAALIGTSLWAAVKAWPPLAVSGFSFMVWRAFGWDTFFHQGCIDPRTKTQIVHTFLHHTLFPAVGYGGAFALGLVSWPALLVPPVFGLIATHLAIQNAKSYDLGVDQNDKTEENRGVAFGVLSGLALGLPV